MTESLLQLLEVLKTTASCSTDDLATICRISATDETCTQFLNKIEEPQSITKHLLEICLEGRADNDNREIDLRRARLAIRTLINCCNRSTKFKKSVTSDLVSYCRCVIRIPEVQVEGCAFLVAIGTELHKEAFLNEDYPNLLTDVLNLWHIMVDTSWISAFILSILETDFAFLSMCYRDLAIDSFSTLLEITETLLDSSETNVILKVHPNNVIFCIDLVERILFEFGEGLQFDTEIVLKNVISILDIIGNCALQVKLYGNELHKKTRAVIMAIEVLESVLHAQSDIEHVEAMKNPRNKYPDRPAIPVTCKVPHVAVDKRLTSLAAALIPLSTVRGNLKCAVVRTIGNLCCDSPQNQKAAGEHGGVVAVLRCTKIRPEDKPFIAQWAIVALRYMIISCPENQDILVSIDQQPSNIIDRDKLLKELGVELIHDEKTGKFKVKQIMHAP